MAPENIQSVVLPCQNKQKDCINLLVLKKTIVSQELSPKSLMLPLNPLFLARVTNL